MLSVINSAVSKRRNVTSRALVAVTMGILNMSVFMLPVITPKVVSAESCTESQAYDKMMALGRAQTRIMNQGGNANMELGMKITLESSPVSELIAAKKYDEACAKYEEIAKTHGIDLKKEQTGMVTFEELKKDGGKRGGSCSLADAQKKLMGMHQQLEDKAALGDVDRDVFRKFSDDTGKFSELMFTDPSEVCRRLDGLKGKYGLQ